MLLLQILLMVLTSHLLHQFQKEHELRCKQANSLHMLDFQRMHVTVLLQNLLFLIYIISDFSEPFGMKSSDNLRSGTKMGDFNKVNIVLDISKHVCGKLSMENFPISQVKFNMRILHWIIVK
ncbi:hypothetical protein RYX36_002649, partial [Vicia faba]